MMMPRQSGAHPAVGGVFSIDPQRTPEMPADASGIEVVNHEGKTIAFVWFAKGHEDPAAIASAYQYLDAHGVTRLRPQLVR